jgi:hypothetical protein
LRKIGFDGPYAGSKHQFLIFQQYRLTVPSNSEYSVPQPRMMLKEAEEIIARPITADEWNDLS